MKISVILATALACFGSANAAITILVNTTTQTITVSGSAQGQNDDVGQTLHEHTFGTAGVLADLDMTSLFDYTGTLGGSALWQFSITDPSVVTFDTTWVSSNTVVTLSGTGGSMSYAGLSPAAITQLEAIPSPTPMSVENGTFVGANNAINIVQVPEPTTGLLAVMAGGIALTRRRRK
jgi:hypothetical protein